MSAPREYPILFSGPMVRALLDGTKTQTRRVIKPQPPNGCEYRINGAMNAALCSVIGSHSLIWVPPTPRSPDHRLPCPYGKPGDRLWVREKWGYIGGTEYLYQHERTGVGYRADHVDLEPIPGGRWRPSIHMPRWASRITLELTDVRVQRVQEISQADAIAEGCPGHPVDGHAEYPDCHWPADEFRDLWDSINAKRGYGWDANPWVWALTFRRITP